MSDSNRKINRIIYVLLIILVLILIYFIFCRERFAALRAIHNFEVYKEINHRLPEQDERKLVDSLITPNKDDVRYVKLTDSTYEIWYGILFNDHIYNSEKKDWRKEPYNP